MERGIAQRGDGQVNFKAVHLAAKGVAVDFGVHHPQDGLMFDANVLRQEDEAGAGSPGGGGAGKAAQRLNQPVLGGQLANGCAFTARDDEAIQPFQVLWQAHLGGLRAQAAQHFFVFNEGALQRQNANLHGVSPRENVVRFAVWLRGVAAALVCRIMR